MAKKYLFWTLTTLLILIAGYVLTSTVILPVVNKNPLPEAALPSAEVKGENNAKKQEKGENTSKKNEKADKNSKKTSVKVQSVPEPTTWALFATGLAAVAIIRSRRVRA